MAPVLLNLIGIAAGGGLWLLLMALFPAIPISNPLTPALAVTSGLVMNKLFFDWVSVKWPGSFLASAVGISFFWRQVLGLGGLGLAFAWLLASG